uniref:Uncharacterized protein n=1 Tax=Tanacetum cinerariifolium TaxID=118510 RepID=A0A6L2MCJ8_TANCI|nr:hypothetical protein [Tanacetum cinerariifolium]
MQIYMLSTRLNPSLMTVVSDHAGVIGESGQQGSGSTSDAHVVDARNKEQQGAYTRSVLNVTDEGVTSTRTQSSSLDNIITYTKRHVKFFGVAVRV